MFSADLKRGSLDLFVLSAIEGRPRHGYEIGKIIEDRSQGKIRLAVSTLYSSLYRLEDRGWIKGRWVEAAGERRRCFYALTPAGRSALADQRKAWETFAAVVTLVIGGSRA
jgi:DNA-binding PadR family transcriptional regulator